MPLHVRQLIAAISAVFILLAGVNNAVLPAFEASDEASHFTYASYLADNRRFPNLNVELPAHEAAQPPLYYVLVAAIISPIDRSDLAAVSRLNPDWFDRELNADYVSVRNLHIRTDAERWPWQRTILAMHVARAVSTLLGVLTLIAVAGIAWTLRPSAVFAVLSAALVAFNPKFVHVASIVTNDIAVIAAATVTLWWLCRLLRETGPPLWRQGVLGMLIGATVLCKLGGLGLGLPALLAVNWRSRTHAVKQLLAIGLGFALVSGPWFVYNALSYGDPLAFDRVRMANESLLRAVPLDPAQMLAAVPALFWSYFAVVGLDLPLPGWAQWAGLVTLIGAVVGCVLLITDTFKAGPGRMALLRSPWTALVVWQVALIVLFVPWLRSYIATENGRLIMPGIALFATLVAAGWLRLMPFALTRPAAFAGSAVFLVMSALTPFTVIQPAYATAALLSEQTVLDKYRLQPSQTTFGGTIRLLHATLGRNRVAAGDVLPITVYWGAIQPAAQSYRVVIDAVDQADRVVGRRVVIPYQGRFATDRWPVGAFFEDRYDLSINNAAQAGAIRVRLGVFAIYPERGFLPIDGSNAQHFDIGRIRLDGPFSPTIDGPGLVRFGDALRLDHVDMQPDRVTFDWAVVAEPGADYTLFVHIHDAAGNRIDQQDAQPFNGGYPTGLWEAGERIRDVRSIALPPEAVEVRIGWYAPDTGQRLPAFKPDGSRWPDDVVLLSR
jgi:Dolichyl-phosphate-mannose-protein mannosyltransferase